MSELENHDKISIPKRMAPLRIAFFGLPLAALLLAKDGHQIVYAAISRTDAPGLRRAWRSISPLRVLPDPGNPRELDTIRSARPDLVVSWFWTRLLPEEVLAVAPLGSVGVHPSLLPRHRGPDPTAWAILLADPVSGVTAHVLANKYDTGAIYGQRELAIAPHWNALQLARALDRPSLQLLREVVKGFANGCPPVPRAQDESGATSAPLVDDVLTEISFGRPTLEVLRQIQAFAPAPGAYTAVGDELVQILRAGPAQAPRALQRPGEVALWNGEVLIRTLDGAVVILEATCNGEELSEGGWARLIR